MLNLYIGLFLVLLFTILQEATIQSYLKIKKIEFRRWRKLIKENMRWHGFFGSLFRELPFHQNIQDFIWYIKHRTTHQYHNIKTGLKPGYYEIETMMEYGLFALLRRFVEKEYDGIKGIEKRIADLEEWKKTPEDNIGAYDYDSEIEQYKEVIRLYKWWTEVYPKYEDNNPWTKYYETHECPPRNLRDSFIVADVDKDGDPLTYQMIDNDPPEVQKFKKDLLETSRHYEVEAIEETTFNMISLIKLRQRLWT
jgi:hypothetical protein